MAYYHFATGVVLLLHLMYQKFLSIFQFYKKRMLWLISLYVPLMIVIYSPVFTFLRQLIYTQITSRDRLIGLVGRVFANGPVDMGSIPGRVIPKTLKMVLDTSLLNTQQYKVHMRHCFLGRLICQQVSERYHLVWRCHLFD